MRFVAAAACLALGGCSLILDFSEPPVSIDAGPPDAIASAACDFGEPNADKTTAFPLDPVTGQDAAICELGDHDFYAIQVLDGQTMSFQITFAQEGAAGDLDMRLLPEPTDVPIARSLSTDANEGIVCPGEGPHCPALAAGTYYMEVFGYEDMQVNSYTIDYTISGP